MQLRCRPPRIYAGLRMNRRNFLASVAVDFVADNPGDTLLHCHQTLHMDFGFMQLMKYVGCHERDLESDEEEKWLPALANDDLRSGVGWRSATLDRWHTIA